MIAALILFRLGCAAAALCYLAPVVAGLRALLHDLSTPT